jgi:hypothetical protein
MTPSIVEKSSSLLASSATIFPQFPLPRIMGLSDLVRRKRNALISPDGVPSSGSEPKKISSAMLAEVMARYTKDQALN